jgi:CHAT domain-containing protein/tetratricopeptide (TPR) repeat protein
MKPQDCTNLPSKKNKKQLYRIILKSQELYFIYLVFFPLFLAILFMTLTLDNLFIRFGKVYNMDDLTKWVSEMVEKLPVPEDFIKEMEKTDKPEKEKGDYFFAIGNRLYQISNFKLASKVWDKALEYYLKFNNKAGEAKCYKGSGLACLELGEFQKGIKYTEKSLALAIAIGDKAGESHCYNNLGNAYAKLANYNKAIEYFNKAFEISKARGDKIVEARSCDNLGSIYIYKGDFQKGLENYLNGLEIFRALGNKDDEATCLVNIGMAYNDLGNLHEAIEYNQKALEMFVAMGNKAGEAHSYMNLSAAYSNLGNFLKSIEYTRKALEIRIAIGDRDEEAFCYQSMGVDYERCGDYHRAIEYYSKSLEITRVIGNKRTEALCFGGLGYAYHFLNDFHKAIEYHNKAIQIAKKIGDKREEAGEYIGLGNAYHKLGDFNTAIEYQNKSLAIAKKIGSKEGEYKCYDGLGMVYASLKDFDKALEYHKKALEVVEEIKDVYAKKDILNNMGDDYINKEDHREGEKYFKQSIEIIENMRRENIPNEYKRSFWQDNIQIFDNLIVSDVKLGKKEEALENSERGKGRTVFDFILGRGIEEKFKPEPLKFKEIQELAKKIEKNLVLFRVTEKGTYSFILNPEDKFDLLEITEFNSKRLEELTVELEAEKPTGGWIHAYSNYKSVTDKIRPLLLEEKVVEAGKILKQEEEKWFKTMDDTLKILYNELIGPVFKRFDKGEKVVLIPNRALNILPLHACFYETANEPNDSESIEYSKASGKRIAVHGKRKYLLDDYEISYAPNCNILDLCHKRDVERRKDNLFAVANPAPPYNLAFSEWEVEEIGKLFDTKEVYIKEEIKDKLLYKIANYNVIHLSTHGIYDLSSSFNSKLLLGKDIDLTLEEIFDKIRIDKSWLVSLSACESGLVDYRDIADEYIGLQTGFLYAGAPTVIASLWTVADFTTAFIMIKTYEYIFKHGLTKSKALRKAQLWLKDLTAGEVSEILQKKEIELEYNVKMAAGDLMPLRIAIKSEDPQSKPFAHPYYWAGFQLFGA